MTVILRRHSVTRCAYLLASICTVLGPILPAHASPRPKRVINWNQGLPEGKKQALTDSQLKEIMAKRAKEAIQPDVQPLSESEMKSLRGRGSYRNKYLCGVLPWHRSLRDVNLCTGNLFKSFTDIQVAPARGAGLALQRTYNSQEERIGPFGIGWTHAYDIRMQDESNAAITDETVNLADRAHARSRRMAEIEMPGYLFGEAYRYLFCREDAYSASSFSRHCVIDI